MTVPHKVIYSYSQNHEDNNTGHKCIFKFRLFHLSSKISWPFNVEYYTKCSAEPTAFQLDLTFNKIPLNGCVNISYRLGRKDYLYPPVDAYITIQISDAYGRVIFQPPNSFGKPRMVSGETIVGNIEGIMLLPEMRNAFNEEMDATIELSVSLCHSDDIKPAENLNTDVNLTPRPKNVT